MIGSAFLGSYFAVASTNFYQHSSIVLGLNKVEHPYLFVFKLWTGLPQIVLHLMTGERQKWSPHKDYTEGCEIFHISFEIFIHIFMILVHYFFAAGFEGFFLLAVWFLYAICVVIMHTMY